MISKIKILFAMAFMLFASLAYAQVPQLFNYQGIARDVKGNPMSNKTMTLKISVLPTADASQAEYQEIQTVKTNEFGLYTLQIGNGTALSGEMKTVKWETGNKYINVAIDPNGGSNYVNAGTNQLLSVPYAIYADKAGTAANADGKTRAGGVVTAAGTTGDANMVAKFNGTANTLTNSSIFDNGSRIGIGTLAPSASAKVHIISASGTQPMILESPIGVHCLFRESGLNRGYFGSYIGSGAPYPTPAGTSNADFDIGTSGSNPTGKLHLATQTTPRVTIDNVGLVGIATTTPTTNLDVNGQIRVRGGAPAAGKVLTSDANGLATWTTPAATGVSGSGTLNYIPKFTPNGTTLGNSLLLNDATGLLYNATLPNTSINGYNSSTDFTFRGSLNAFVINKNQAVENQLIMTNPFNNIIMMSDSIKLQNGGLFDSVSIIANDVSYNTSFIGGYYGGLKIRNSDGRMANTSAFGGAVKNAQFSINTSYDTAAQFTSSSSNYLSGILRAEYTGPQSTHDNIGIYSKSVVQHNYGYGIIGEGGFYGVYGKTDSFGAAGVLAYGQGNAYGITASSQNGRAINGNSNGLNAATFYAYGTNGIGTYTYGDSVGSRNVGRYIGVLASGSNTSGSGYTYGVNASATSSVGRSYGINASAVGNNAIWNSYGIYAEATGVASTLYAGYFAGQIYATTGTFGTKPFTIDHPLDPANKVLRHSSIESNDMMDMYNGNIVTDANGFATITLPNYFEALNENFKYQLTVIGTFAQAIIKEKIVNNQFVIQTNQPNVEVSWQVAGVRHDAVAKKFPIIVEENKVGENVGRYFEPEAYGVNKTLRIGYQEPSSVNNNPIEEALQAKKDSEKIEAAHNANNEAASRNWKQQQAPKNTLSSGSNAAAATPIK